MNKKDNNLGKTTLFICLLILATYFAFSCQLFARQSVKFGDSRVSYNEVGNIDYKVYLKDNNYYTDTYLGKGMKYIANLINTINVDFNYEMNTSKFLNYNYTYKVTADLTVTDKNSSTKVFQKPDILVAKTTKQITDNDFTIDKNIVIDYDEYNNYVNAFKNEYHLTGSNVNSNLIITMDIEVDGKYKKSNLLRDNQLKVTIPMSEQTFEIAIDTRELNNNGLLTDTSIFTIKDRNSFIISIVFGTICIILLIVAFYIFFKRPKDKYKATINKILKEYDRIIVNSKTINELDYENIITVSNIEELVDAYDTVKQPILYYEVIPNIKSYFLIIDDKTLYKLTIKR